MSNEKTKRNINMNIKHFSKDGELLREIQTRNNQLQFDNVKKEVK